MNISKIANINRTILITGSTGVGKSVLAKNIYDLSSIFKRSFIVLNIASVKEELIESELFGHKKGAFTGAIDNKVGYFQKAYGATLFIDEIGELSLDSQKKLLQVLEDKKFTPVGSTEECVFDGRLIFATNKNLKHEVEIGNFREDLYFRLMTLNIKLPDISDDKVKLKEILLCEFEKAKKEFSNVDLLISDELLNYFLAYKWPGNRREIKNTMEYLTINFENKILTIDDLPKWIEEEKILKTSENYDNFIHDNYKDSLEAFEKYYFNHILTKNHGRINETFKEIGISKVTLIHKARKYRINTQLLKGLNHETKMHSNVA